jgi:hypothetical protein
VTELGETTETVNELVMETAQADEKSVAQTEWHRQVAMSTLLLALITAVGALLAGITAHEALLEGTKEVIDISIIENDRVSVDVLKAKVDIINELGGTPKTSDLALIHAYEEEIRTLEEVAALEESIVQTSTATHLILAVAVTLLSVGITLSGMSIIVGQKFLWLAGLIFGILGSLGVVMGVFNMVL